MAIGDHYRLKLSGNYLGQTIINTFYYENVLTNSTAPFLNLDFLDDILPAIQAVVSDQVTFTDTEVQNLDNPSDFSVSAFSNPGLRAGQPTPPFVAWGYTLYSNNLVHRSGGKRFAGVAEPDIDNGVPVGSVLTPLNLLAIRMGAALPTGGTAVWRPRIARITYVDSVPSYEWTVCNASAFKWVTSQNTRKFNVGV